MNARLRKQGGGLTLLGKIVSVAVGLISLLGTLAFASVRILGLETAAAHTQDIASLRQENVREWKIVRGLLECHMQGVRYENCPATKADLEKP